MKDGADRLDGAVPLDLAQLHRSEARLETIAVIAELDEVPKHTLVSLLAEIDGLQEALIAEQRSPQAFHDGSAEVDRLQRAAAVIGLRLRSNDLWW